MSLYPPRLPKAPAPGPSEFEILKSHHKFLRDDSDSNTVGPSSSAWAERLAAKYESSLFREFALCDLKHYKSGNFSLRWRTEDEVVSGAGESSCSNTRCEYHIPREDEKPTTSLSTLELPFAYEEHGEEKTALVKVVLCRRCVKKLLWKRTKEKAAIQKSQSVEPTTEQEHTKRPEPKPTDTRKRYAPY
ncbi:folate-sensitive fragile site protein Fra10Ac1-domain-containing protein [Flagelloscypha sp. PMI_526]|nr:folate-sensitive fragile site protein Fra10Ac1-domain-containing protein [Flagelloscypha sp. PMI_526]